VPDIATILSSGSGNPWFYLPFAVLLGALHGLEPGHSKSMMAAFIIAVRGTMGQAVLLGLCAALSHSMVVAAVALLGLHYGSEWVTGQVEPYLLIVSGILIIAMALWTMSRLLPDDHDHHHDHLHGPDCDHDHDGHDHDDHEDAHAAAHAREIAEKFAGRSATTGQIAIFGLTAGLLPCPAAITVLLIALQLKAFVLGAAMVAAFSIGLALTLVTVGVAAAWALRHARARMQTSAHWLEKLPLISSALMIVLGAVMLWQGVSAL